ncbi:phage tail tape measure protein [Bacillus cytotoxicus]|uniref:phage tail tape measure protein n=1 Tax=Bacillus cytotoxicus TaxID=580165 RepID=UPI003D7E11A1
MEVFKMFGSVFLRDEKARKGLKDLDSHAAKTSKGMGDKFGSLGGVFGKLGVSISGTVASMVAMTGAVVGVGAAIAGAVSVGMDYTKQMSKVEALSGSTGLQMAELGANARKLGAETRWSATNVAEAYEYMALAGWDSNQMIAASKPLLDLATAGALDLAKASDIVTDTMTPFGMAAEEAGRAADVFAVAQSSANLNVEQLGETMKYAAPQAATFGMDLEQTSAIAMIFANSGIKASMAGTALRAGLSRLAAPPKAAAKALDEMGVSVKNADGTLRPMRDIIADMAPKFNNMANAQQIAAAKAIFGEEAYAGWVQVLKGGVDQFDDFTEKLYTSEGAASVMADVMANNLSGAVDGVKSRAENLGLVIFSHLEPALVGATNGTNSLIKSFTDFLDPSGRAVEAAKLMQSEEQKLAQTKAILQNKVAQGKMSQEEMNAEYAKAQEQMQKNLTVEGMMAQKKEELKSKVEEGKISQEQANKILEQSEVEYQKLANGIEQTKSRQEAFNAALAPLREGVQWISEVTEAIGLMWQAAQGDQTANVEGSNLLTKLGFSPEAVIWVRETVAEVQNGIALIQSLVSGDWGAATNIMDKLGMSPEKKTEIISFAQDVHAEISNFITNVQSLISAASPVIMGIIGATWDFIKGIFETIAPYLMPLLTDVLNFVNGIIEQIASFWKENGEQIVQAVQNAFSIIQSIISVVMPVITAIVKSAWDAIKDIIQGGVNIIMGIIKFFASLLTGDFRGMWDAAKQIFSGAIQFIWGLINLSFVTKILGAAKNLAVSFGSAIRGMWTTVVNYFKEFIKHPVSLVVRMATDIGSAALKITKKLVDPIKNAWDGIKGWLKTIKDGVVNMFKGIHIPVPKVSVNGSLNPMNWVSEGLPSFSIKWAAQGALVKPGMPTVIGVGDAKGYDEAVLPLRDSTLGRIGQEIAQTMPQTTYKQSYDRPIELVVNLDKREIAREIYTDVQKFSQQQEDIRNAF